jgi:aspartate racemase
LLWMHCSGVSMPFTEQIHRCTTSQSAHAWLADQRRRWRERSRLDGARAADQRHPSVTLHYLPPQSRGTPLLLLGGMGPLAGLDGFAQAQARNPQREIMLHQACRLPCRTLAIKAEARGDASVATALVDGLGAAIDQLLPRLRERAEMVMLCNTAHHYLPHLTGRLPGGVRLHSLPKAAITAAGHLAPRRLMLLATEGGRLSGIYARVAARAGLRLLELDVEEHRLLQKAIVRGVKGGNEAILLAAGGALLQRLSRRPEPPDALLAGCTEIPIILAALRERGSDLCRNYLARTAVIDPVVETLDALSSGQD